GGSEVLGTFAVYYRESRSPTAEELESVERAAEVTRLAIERYCSDAQIGMLLHNERAARTEVETLNQELQRTLHFSDTFVGILGHDLRNPLGAIITGTELLLMRGLDEKTLH